MLLPVAGRGEVNCVGHAHATGIKIVVSNNHTEFKYLNKPIPPIVNTYAVMINYYHILTIAYYHKKITKTEAEEFYNKVNEVKKSSHKFTRKLNDSVEYFIENNYLNFFELDFLI